MRLRIFGNADSGVRYAKQRFLTGGKHTNLHMPFIGIFQCIFNQIRSHLLKAHCVAGNRRLLQRGTQRNPLLVGKRLQAIQYAVRHGIQPYRHSLHLAFRFIDLYQAQKIRDYARKPVYFMVYVLKELFHQRRIRVFLIKDGFRKQFHGGKRRFQFV